MINQNKNLFELNTTINIGTLCFKLITVITTNIYA